MLKTRWVVLGFSVFIILVTVSAMALHIQLPRHEQQLGGIPFASGGVPPIIGVFSPSTASSSLTLFRTNDGIAQAFPGDWQINFLSPYSAAVFGVTEAQKNAQRLFIVTGLTGKQIAISKLPGQITHVSSNPAGTYLLVTGIRATATSSDTNEFYSCIADISVATFECKDIVSDILHAAPSASPHVIVFWNTSKDHELVIADQQTGTYHTFDPWDDAPKNSDAAYANNAALKLSPKQGMYSYKHIGPIVIAKNIQTNQRKTFLVWPWSHVRPLTEGILVLETRGRIEFLNVMQNTKAVFTTQNPGATLVSYFKNL